MKNFLSKGFALLSLSILLASCVPSNIPSGARAVTINGATAYVFEATGSGLLPDIRINWGAKRIEGEALSRARAADLRDAPFTCPEAEAFAWFRALGANEPGIVMPDFKLQLESRGYRVSEQSARQSGASSFQYQVVSRGQQLFFLTWIWSPTTNPSQVSLDVCKVQMKPGAPPLRLTWQPRTSGTLQ